MKLISENLHIVSAIIKEALVNRDEEFIKNLLIKQIQTNPDWIDFNIGPAKKNFSGSMKWLTQITNTLTDIPISFDSTNIGEITEGLSSVKNPSTSIINSTSADAERLNLYTDTASKFNCNLIALTMNKELGIPKTADERLELAFEINEAALSKGVENDKLFLDPLILPMCVEQSQGVEVLNCIRMFKESFDPPVNTVVGLSNISNGCPKELRGLINRVFFVMAAGCGLDCAIVDSFDAELLRLNSVIETKNIQKPSDKVIISLYELVRDFGELDDLSYDLNDDEQVAIYKTAQVLLNKKIYSNSYLEI